MYLSKFQSVFVSIIKCICRFGRKIIHIICVITWDYISRRIRCRSRVCGQLNWLHLYSSSFLQGRICISPHRLICISFKDTSVFLHTGWFVFLGSAVMVTSLQRFGFLFPTVSEGSTYNICSCICDRHCHYDGHQHHSRYQEHLHRRYRHHRQSGRHTLCFARISK